MPLTDSSRLVRDPDLVQTDMDGYTMLMSIESGKFFSINPLGSRIWEILERPARLDAVCQTLLEEFEIEPEQCQEEVVAFLESLLNQRLVRVQD